MCADRISAAEVKIEMGYGFTTRTKDGLGRAPVHVEIALAGRWTVKSDSGITAPFAETG